MKIINKTNDAIYVMDKYVAKDGVQDIELRPFRSIHIHSNDGSAIIYVDQFARVSSSIFGKLLAMHMEETNEMYIGIDHSTMSIEDMIDNAKFIRL